MKKDIIINRQLCHFFRSGAKLAMVIVKAWGVDVDAMMEEMKHKPAASIPS